MERHTRALLLLAFFALSVFALSACGGEATQEPAWEDAREITGDSQEYAPDTPDESDGITPLLWRVTSPAGQNMYLFGSIHAGDASIYPLPDFIMDAFHRADYLAVEFDMYAFQNNMPALIQMNQMLMYTPFDRGIIYDLGEDLHARAVAAIEEGGLLDGTGITIEMLNMFRPPMWSDVLRMAALEEAEMDFEYGIDIYFIHAAMERGIPILELETWQSQVEMILNFSQELTRILLDGALDIEEGGRSLRVLYEAWQRGNKAEIERLIAADGDGVPPHLWQEYMDAMLLYRDIAMTEVAREYMRDGKNVFVVVGLAHLVGDNTIVYNLRGYGYTVEVQR